MCAQQHRRSVPSYPSSLVGRETELETLLLLVADPNIPLITVTGTAGVGKTRLVAALVGSDHVENSLFVSLAAVREPDLVLGELARALDIQGTDLVAPIRERLQQWSGVIVLDNFEQVIDAAAEIAKILPHNPGLTVLVTSQRPLQIGNERLIRLSPLPVPNANSDMASTRSAPSVQLLISKVIEQDAMPEEALDDSTTVGAIAEICRMLEGIPLAIELAASRLASLTPEVVLTQLEQGHEILASQRRDTPERHRTMHASVRWSADLLPADTRRLFLWLGPFTAGFNLHIVERISSHLGVDTRSYDTISDLTNLSLIQRVSGGENPWYTMLVSIRDFCLAELDATGQRSEAEAYAAEHVVGIADESEAKLTGPDASEWTRVLDRELPTIRSVIQRAITENQHETIIVIARGTARYMEQIGQRVEVGQWLNHALQNPEMLPELALIDGLITRLKLQESGREFSEAEATGEKLASLLEGHNLPLRQVQYLHNMGNVAQMQFQTDRAQGFFEKTVEIANQHGLRREAAIAHGMLGMGWSNRGDFAKAEEHYLELRRVMVEIGDTHTEVRVLINLSAAAISQGQPERSLDYLDEALERIRILDHKRELIYILLNQSVTLITLGELDAATDAAEEAVQVAQNHHYPLGVAGGYHELCEIYLLKKGYALSASAAIHALDALPDGELDAHLHAGLGVFMSEALASTGHMNDSAALLTRALHFATDREFTFGVAIRDRIENLNAIHASEVTNLAQQAERGASWTDAEYLQNLRRYARRLASRGSSVLVRIEEPTTEPYAELTARENEILDLLANGSSTQQMADQLHVSPRTITTHVGNILSKLQVSSRAEAVAKVLRSRN